MYEKEVQKAYIQWQRYCSYGRKIYITVFISRYRHTLGSSEYNYKSNVYPYTPLYVHVAHGKAAWVGIETVHGSILL